MINSGYREDGGEKWARLLKNGQGFLNMRLIIGSRVIVQICTERNGTVMS